MTDHKDLIERLAWPVNPREPKEEVNLPAWVLELCAEARDALEAAQEQCVEVKQLEWERSVSVGEAYEANTIFGEYVCGIDNYGIAYGSNTPNCVAWSDFRSLEAAKAAAQSDYESRVLSDITTRTVSDVCAEATAAAYGAAVDICKDYSNHYTKNHAEAQSNYDKLLFGSAAVIAEQIEVDILALTPQSARDWLEEREAEAYRKGQEDMRERAALICREAVFDDPIDSTERFRNRALTGCEVKIRALPIKEKDDE